MEYKTLNIGDRCLYKGLIGHQKHLNGEECEITQLRAPDVIHTQSIDGLLIVGIDNLE